MDTARKHLYDLLVPRLPKNWKLYPYYGNRDAIEPGTVMAEMILTSVTKNPENPLGSHLVQITLVLSEGAKDPEFREDFLDSNLDDFLYSLNGLGALGVRWTTANRTVTEDDQYLGFNVELEVITEIDLPEPTTPKEPN